MNRKGLLKLVIVIASMTFVLGVYTIFALCLSGPRTTNVAVVLLDGQTTTFASKKVSMTGDVDALVYDEATKTYTAVNSNENSVDTVKSLVVTAKKAYGKKVVYDVKIYRIGQGTINDPYNINRAEVLVSRFAEAGANLNSFDLVDDIDLTNIDWKPFGNIANEFVGTFDGNGHKIDNMKINVTNENKADYITVDTEGGNNYKYLSVGFFGVTWKDARILNVSLTNFDINFASDVTLDDVFAWDIGSLIGYANGTEITGVEARSDVSGKINETSFGASYGATGGVVGSARFTQIANYNVDVAVVSQKTGAYVGGVVGCNLVKLSETDVNTENNVKDSSIKNCVVQANVELDLTQTGETYFAGIAAQAGNLIVEDVRVKSLNVTRKEGVYANPNDANSPDDIVAGAFGKIRGVNYEDGTLSGTIIKKVVVESMNVKVPNATIAGFAYYVQDDKTQITNCAVLGSTVLDGRYAAGFVTFNRGVIEYTEDFAEEYAVRAEVLGYSYASGFATYNYGLIKNVAETKQKVDVKVTWTGNKYYGAAIVEADANAFNASSKILNIAGMCNSMSGATAEISGFDVTAHLINGLNMAGLVGEMGIQKVLAKDGDNYVVRYKDTITNTNREVNTLSGGKLDNCVVNAKFSTLTYTNMVAGAVCETAKDVVVNNVTATVTLKTADANSTIGACAAVVGGLVAKVCDDDVTITNCKVTNSDITVDNSDIINVSGSVKYKIHVVGGLVGMARAYLEGVDEYYVTNLTITNCVVENSIITSNVNLNDYHTNEHGRCVTNGIAGFMGMLQVNAGGLVVTGCSVTGITLDINSTKIVEKHLFDYVVPIATKDVFNDLSGVTYSNCHIAE